MSFLYSVDLPDQVGDRLDNLSPIPIGYGKVINLVKGTRRITATLIEQFPLVETVHEEEVEAGGKGGSSSYTNTTYTYSATFAVMLCAQRIEGVRRIWMNSKLFYENYAFMSGSPLLAKQASESKFNLYTGEHDQPVDPILASRHGDLTPAYRGRSYIVFDDIQLEQFGNRIPVIEVEVVENGVGGTGDFVVPYPMYLRDIVGEICFRCGLDMGFVDTSELDIEVDGYALTGDSTGIQEIESLAEIYNFQVVDVGESIRFIRDPLPITRAEHNENCLFNEHGLIANAYHEVLGRQGYFPSTAGTSEGQFLILRAACLAYQETGDANWMKLIDNCLKGIDIMYGQGTPSDPSVLYIPHWLFNVKAPVQSQSDSLNTKVMFTYNASAGVYNGFIPSGYPSYGDKIKDITQVYSVNSSFLDWYNPYAGVIGDSYGNDVRISTTSAGTTITVPDTKVGAISDGATLEMNVVIIYNFGAALSVSQLMEAWAYWRPLEDGEIDCAVDTLAWAYEVFKLLYEVKGEQRWLDALAATEQSIYRTFAVDDGRGWIRLLTDSPLAQAGSYFISERKGVSISDVTRNPDLSIRIPIPDNEGEVSEVQFGRAVSDNLDANDTSIRIKLSGNFSGSPSIISVFVQSGNDVFDIGTRRYINHISVNPTINGDFEIDLEAPLSDFDEFITSIGGSSPTSKTLADNIVNFGSVNIDVIGVIYTSPSALDLNISEIRPLPVVQLPYTPYVAPYTANAIHGELIDWRGAGGVGYQDPVLWATLNNDTALGVMMDYIEDSENEYNTRYGQRIGLFVPSYVWDRFDREQVTDAEPNTWTFEWVDPNSEWVGYTARVIAACGQGGDIAVNKGLITNGNRALDVAARFCQWLNGVWTDPNKFIPTNFPETITFAGRSTPFEQGDIATPYNGFVYEATQLGTGITSASGIAFPTTLYDTVQDGEVLWRCVGYTYGTTPVYGVYDEPHAASLIMRGAAFAYKNNKNTTDSLAIVQRTWAYLERLWANATGDVTDTWSHNPDNGEWFGFWSGEIVTTLSMLLGELESVRIAAGISDSVVRARLDDHVEWLLSKSRTINTPDLDDFITERDYTITRKKESELPKTVELKYLSKLRADSDDMRSATKLSAKGDDIKTMNTNIAMSGDVAANLASTALMKEWSQRTEYQFELISRVHQAGDVIEFNIDGTPRLMKITDATLSPKGFVKVDAVSYSPSAFNRSLRQSGGEVRRTTGIEGVANTIITSLDIPLYSSTQDSYGFMAYAVPQGKNWRGGRLMASIDDNQYSTLASFIKPPTYGTAANSLPYHAATTPDIVNAIHINNLTDSLSSVSKEDWYRGRNKLLVGNEIIYFQNALVQGDGTWICTNLLRGRHGTSNSAYGHVEGERVVLLSGEGLVNVTINSSDVGVNRFYKAVSTTQSEADVEAYQQVITSERMKPLAPAHLRVRRLQDTVDVDWKRQTRYGAEWVDNREALLDTSSEKYIVRFYSNPDDESAKYTIEVSEPKLSVNYTDLNASGLDTNQLFTVKVSQKTLEYGDGSTIEISA